mgnify:CR=1 FL=1|tara:strand:+ start:92 stop:280 length:189 start_codon:yes stop_codon:yes gene_type:complete
MKEYVIAKKDAKRVKWSWILIAASITLTHTVLSFVPTALTVVGKVRFTLAVKAGNYWRNEHD